MVFSSFKNMRGRDSGNVPALNVLAGQVRTSIDQRHPATDITADKLGKHA